MLARRVRRDVAGLPGRSVFQRRSTSVVSWVDQRLCKCNARVSSRFKSRSTSMLVVLDVRDIRRDAIRVTQSIFLRNSPTETVASRISRTTIGHGNGDACRRLVRPNYAGNRVNCDIIARLEAHSDFQPVRPNSRRVTPPCR